MKRTLRLGQEACASLLANRLRTSLMMLGLVIGVASLTAVICIGQGTRAKVMHMVAKQGWDLIMVRAGSAKQVFAPTTDRTIASLVEADAQAIEAELGNIRYVSAVQNSARLGSHRGRQIGEDPHLRSRPDLASHPAPAGRARRIPQPGRRGEHEQGGHPRLAHGQDALWRRQPGGPDHSDRQRGVPGQRRVRRGRRDSGRR